MAPRSCGHSTVDHSGHDAVRLRRRPRRQRHRCPRSRRHRRRRAHHPRCEAPRGPARRRAVGRCGQGRHRRSVRPVRDVRDRGTTRTDRPRLRLGAGSGGQAGSAIHLHRAEVRRHRAGDPGRQVRRGDVGHDRHQGAPADPGLRGLLRVRLGHPRHRGEPASHHRTRRSVRQEGGCRGRHPPAGRTQGPSGRMQGRRQGARLHPDVPEGLGCPTGPAIKESRKPTC